jgi:ribosomal protein L40E
MPDKKSDIEPRVTWSWDELTEEDRKFMKQCSGCGAWSPLASEVCKSCGGKVFVGRKGPGRVEASSLPVAEKTQEALPQQLPARLPVKFCIYCGRKLSSEARFCDACGRAQA